MNSWIRAYFISKWIIILGLGPMLYALSLKVFLLVLNIIIHWEAYENYRKFVNSFYEITFWIGLPIIFFIFFKRQRETHYTHIKEVTQRFKVGVVLTFLGHVGLVLIILTMMYPEILDHVFYIPYMIWVSLFYIIGLSMIHEFLDIQKNKS